MIRAFIPVLGYASVAVIVVAVLLSVVRRIGTDPYGPTGPASTTASLRCAKPPDRLFRRPDCPVQPSPPGSGYPWALAGDQQQDPRDDQACLDKGLNTATGSRSRTCLPTHAPPAAAGASASPISPVRTAEAPNTTSLVTCTARRRCGLGPM